MRGRPQKLAKPNQHEAQALRIIARYGRMRVTMINGRAHFTAGQVEIANQVARNLIRQGRVRSRRRTALFAGGFDQVYDVLRPTNASKQEEVFNRTPPEAPALAAVKPFI
jgi:hypothetical protein